MRWRRRPESRHSISRIPQLPCPSQSPSCDPQNLNKVCISSRGTFHSCTIWRKQELEALVALLEKSWHPPGEALIDGQLLRKRLGIGGGITSLLI